MIRANKTFENINLALPGSFIVVSFFWHLEGIKRKLGKDSKYIAKESPLTVLCVLRCNKRKGVTD